MAGGVRAQKHGAGCEGRAWERTDRPKPGAARLTLAAAGPQRGFWPLAQGILRGWGTQRRSEQRERRGAGEPRRPGRCGPRAGEAWRGAARSPGGRDATTTTAATSGMESYSVARVFRLRGERSEPRGGRGAEPPQALRGGAARSERSEPDDSSLQNGRPRRWGI